MDDQENEREALEQLLIDASAEPIMLSHAVLKDITNCFSKVIGHGGFGEVYKGVLQNGEVAVKKLYNTDAFSEKQFEDELICLIRVKHKNIVRFLGYCSDTQQKVVEYNGRHVLADYRRRYLCFEYEPNRSLDDYLKDESHRCEWDTHYQLIEGICQGLHYLHKKERISHLDLKPGNILLDAEMVPKITDFGISRRFSGAQSVIITKTLRGSLGYIAPELLNRGEISFKSDIFSLGIIIRNLLRGSTDFSNFEDWHQSQDIDCPQMKRCITIAQLCVEDDPRKRPTIDCIIDMLSGKETVTQLQLSYDSMQFLGIDRGKVHSASETSTTGVSKLADRLQAMGVSTAPSQLQQIVSVPKGPGETSSSETITNRVSKLVDGVQPMSVSTVPSQLQRIISVPKGPGETSSSEIRSLGSTEISELLDVHPLVLRFPFEPNKHIQCPVSLTNRTDQYVGVWIRQTNPDTRSNLHFPVSLAHHYLEAGSWSSLLVILEPHSTLVEAMTLEEQPQPHLQDPAKFEVLMIVMGSVSDLRNLESSISGYVNLDNQFWWRVEEFRGEVHLAMLTTIVICDPASCQEVTRNQKFIPATPEFGDILCIDVHPTKTWILVGHFGFFTKEDGMKIDCPKGYVSIWNYETQEIVTALQVIRKPGILNLACSIRLAKFIVREQWFATGDDGGCVHVYAYTTKYKVKELLAYNGCSVMLAVHPTYPFLLTGSCGDTWIKLWDWSKGWACIRRFDVHSKDGVLRLMFNPRDRHTFASVSDDGTLKVWDIGSSNLVTTLSSRQNVEYLSTDSHQHFLVTCGYNDHNWCVDIWDSQTRKLVHTLYVSGRRMRDVACHPTLPLFVALLDDMHGLSLCLWNANTYRLEKMVHSMNVRIHGYMLHGAMLFTGNKDLTRLVVGSEPRIALMEIKG